MRVRSLFKRTAIILFLATIGILIILLVFGIDSEPLLVGEESLSSEDVERIKQQWEENDPRKLLPGQIKNLVITERDLNLFLHYASSRFFQNEQLKLRVELYPNSAYIWSTFTLPFTLFGSYLNVSAMVSQMSGDIVIKELRIGALKVPSWLGNFFMHYTYRQVQNSEKYRMFTEVVQAVKDFRLQQSRMLLVYQWKPDMMSQIQTRSRDFLLPEADQDRLQVYNEHLVEISRIVSGPSISLIKFLKPLFGIARKRTSSGNDPVAENQIVLLTLAIYVNKKTVRELLNSEDVLAYPRPRQLDVTLLNRHDLARHFLTSAAIAASTDTNVADALGVFKEIDDSRSGTGFSFADLAADRAGVRFAEMATSSSQQAQLLQERLSRVKREADFMPQVDHLPEGIMALELKRRYGDLDSATYRMVNDEIERRLAACWIYH